MKSIRRQLVLTLVLCLSVLFAAASTALYLFVRDALKTQFDEALSTKVLSFAEMVEGETEDGQVSIELEFADFPLPEFRPSPDAEFYQVWTDGGVVLARSASLEGRDLPATEAGVSRPLLADIALPDGRPGRAAAVWFSPPLASEQGAGGVELGAGAAEEKAGTSELGTRAADQQPPGQRLRLVMARSRQGLDRALAGVLVGFGVMWGLLILGLTLTVRWSVGRGLAPLERIAEGAASVASNSLSYRFATAGLPRELAPIAERLNELLGRIEAAFKRERRFSADVAHELRTPLAELKTLAEVALRMPPGPGYEAPARASFSDVLDVARQMERVVATLLSLVRCEAGQQAVQLEVVDLADLVKRAAAPYEAEARDRDLALDMRLPGAAEVQTDRALLASILANLFANAVGHTPRGGSISCEVAARNGGAAVTLRNTNDTLAAEDLPHIFEPFWRKDTARADGSKTGLGLSIAAAYARLLSVQLVPNLPATGLFEMTVLIPGRASPSPRRP